MMSFDHDGPVDSVCVVVNESIFKRIKAVQQLTQECDKFTLVRCSGHLDDLIRYSREFEYCVLIVESSALLEATPGQVSELLHRPSSLRVLAQVDRDEAVLVRDLIMLGCFGILRDDTSLLCLQRILFSATRGEMWVPRKLLSQAFQALLCEQNFSRLSRRECEVLALLGQRLSNQQIAERLFISKETLRWHLRNLYTKTRVQGRDKLIQYASEFNQIGPRAPVEELHVPFKRSLTKAAAFS